MKALKGPPLGVRLTSSAATGEECLFAISREYRIISANIMIIFYQHIATQHKGSIANAVSNNSNIAYRRKPNSRSWQYLHSILNLLEFIRYSMVFGGGDNGFSTSYGIYFHRVVHTPLCPLWSKWRRTLI